MTLIVRRWAILATQVIRIYRPIRKRDLIVVRVVIRTRKSVRRSKLVMIRKTSFETQQQPVVLRSHTRFEILHDVRSANDRIERHGSDDATDDEVGANVAHVIGTESKLATKLAGVQREFGSKFALRADYVRNIGTHFIIGRVIGTVPLNPVVGGPDIVKNLEPSVRTKYDGLLLSLERRFARWYQFRASYTLSRSANYANDDQIPFSNGPIDSNDLRREYGPTPNDQSHRFSFSGVFHLPGEIKVAPILTLASSVPIDILLPDGSSRVCELQRNAGARQFHTGAELNAALTQINAAGGSLCPNADPSTGFKPRVLLPLVRDDLKLGDTFSSLDLRVSRVFKIGERFTIEPIGEVFNLFNVTNVLGVSNVNYSGFNNVLVPDSTDPSNPASRRSSSFGQPVSTAGGVFGSGGPRAFQFAARVTF